jgi:polyhydroxyalkanoate synthesis regulator phasin
MTYRHLQKRLREARKLEDTTALASQIWLAGLGALARAQQEGRDYFDQLVECGKVMEAIEEDDGLRDLKQMARRVLADPGDDHSDAPTREEIRSLAETIQNFDLHLADLEIR